MSTWKSGSSMCQMCSNKDVKIINSQNIILILVLLIAVTSSSCVIAEKNINSGQKVIESYLNGKSYYHLNYSLNKDNIRLLDKLSQSRFYQNGGQFEILLDKERFPVEAPNCKSNIILRMPWTNPNIQHSVKFIGDKYRLYKKISQIVDEKSDAEMQVILELNPYIKVSNDKVKLTNCNVFFRHSEGAYVSKIKSKNR